MPSGEKSCPGRRASMCGICLGELCAILNSATCSVFGPGRFLRGRGGLQAAETAVQILEEKSEVTISYFLAGLYFIVISSSLKAFIQYSFFNGFIVTIGLIGMTYVLIISGKKHTPTTYSETTKQCSITFALAAVPFFVASLEALQYYTKFPLMHELPN